MMNKQLLFGCIAALAASVVSAGSSVRAVAADLLNVDNLYGYGNHVEIPEKTSIRMERLPESVRLVFEFWDEDGVVDPKRLKESMIQEPFGETREGEFVFGSEVETLRGAFGPSGRLWTNGRENFRTTSVLTNGCWTYTVEVPLACIPRATGDGDAFFADFYRKSKSGFYHWVDNSDASPESARGGRLVRLAPPKGEALRFVNDMDTKGCFRACWVRDFHRIAFEPSGGASGGCFRIVNTNATGDVYFHNGTVPGMKNCFVLLPSVAMSVVSRIKVKGKGKIRFGFMPWTSDRKVLYPAERTVREYVIDSPDRWLTIQDGQEPRADRLYAERAECLLPSLWLAPGGDILVDDLEVSVYRDNVSDMTSVVFPQGRATAATPFVDRTPEMRGAFVPDEWKDARAKDGVLFLQDRRMFYVAAQTSGTDLTLACIKPDGTPFEVKVTPEGETSKPFGQPVYAYVNRTADGKTIYRLALPKWQFHD